MNNKKSVQTEAELGRALAELIPELNLRLLSETEPSSTLLWVESVTVTAFDAGSGGFSGFSGPGGRAVRNCLTGLWARVRSRRK